MNATRLEAQALNDFTAAVEYKKIHRAHIENENFLLSVFRDDIMVLCNALEKYFEIENAFKLYLRTDDDEQRTLEEYWDTPIVPYPFSQVMVNLRNHYKCGMSTSEPLS